MLYLILLKKKKNRKPHHARGSGRITTKPKSCWKFIVYFIIILKHQNNPRREKEGEKRVKTDMTKRLSPREREKIPRAEGKKGEAKNKTKKPTGEHHTLPSGTRDEGVHISCIYIYIAHITFSPLLPFFW